MSKRNWIAHDAERGEDDTFETELEAMHYLETSSEGYLDEGYVSGESYVARITHRMTNNNGSLGFTSTEGAK